MSKPFAVCDVSQSPGVSDNTANAYDFAEGLWGRTERGFQMESRWVSHGEFRIETIAFMRK